MGPAPQVFAILEVRLAGGAAAAAASTDVSAVWARPSPHTLLQAAQMLCFYQRSQSTRRLSQNLICLPNVCQLAALVHFYTHRVNKRWRKPTIEKYQNISSNINETLLSKQMTNCLWRRSRNHNQETLKHPLANVQMYVAHAATSAEINSHTTDCKQRHLADEGMWLEPNEDEMGLLHIHAYEHKQQVFRLYDVHVWARGKHEYIVIDIVDHTVLLAKECLLTGLSISHHLALIAVACMLMAQEKVAGQRISDIAACQRVPTFLQSNGSR